MTRASKCVATLRYNYTVPVTTAAWVEILAALDHDVREVEVFDSSGQTLQLGYGPSGSEVVGFQIVPGGNGRVEQLLNKGMRLALKAVSATASTGECTINFYY